MLLAAMYASPLPAGLKTRLEHDDNSEPGERYTWCLGAPQLFNSAIVLGVLATQEQSRGTHNVDAVVNDLESYCDKQKHEMWINNIRLAEVRSLKCALRDLNDRPRQNRRRLIGNCESGPNSVGRRRGSESRQRGNSQSGRATSSQNPRTLLYGAEFAQVQSHPSLAAGWDPGNTMWSSGRSRESGLGRSPHNSEAFTSN